LTAKCRHPQGCRHFVLCAQHRERRAKQDLGSRPAPVSHGVLPRCPL